MTSVGEIQMFKGFFHEKTNVRRGPGIEITEDALTEGWWPQDDRAYLIQRRISRDGKITFQRLYNDPTKSKK